jgi:Zn-dependent peptidase ImmA (M78 family)
MANRILDGVRYGDDGIPIFSKETISQSVERFLEGLDPEIHSLITSHPMPVPLDEICKRLESYGATFVFDEDLGMNPYGRQILGKVRTKGRVIFVDPSLGKGSLRWRFVLAHELGHFALHRGIDAKKLEETNIADHNMEIRDSEEMFDGYLAWLGIRNRTPNAWLEWQANTFASTLLLPEEMFKFETLRIMSELGIRPRGKAPIYVDMQSCNITNLRTILQRLSNTFHVASICIKYRLTALEMLEDDRKNQGGHISQPIINFIESLAIQ